MALFRWLIPCLILCGALSAAFAVEEQLAGIRIGMKPQQVTDLLGDPTAIIIAQPPLTGAKANNGAASTRTMGGSPLAWQPWNNNALQTETPNTLLFIYGGQELELTPSVMSHGVGTQAAAARPFSMMMMNPMMNPMNAQGPHKNAPTLPIWAYTVRVYQLALDQQELIYHINSTYSLGITISGQGAEAKVSDIIACSFAPFAIKTDANLYAIDEQKSYHVKAEKALSFDYPLKKRAFPAGTSKQVRIGSTLMEVLKAHGWPDGFLAFNSDDMAVIPLGKIPPAPENTGTLTPMGMMMMPPILGGLMPPPNIGLNIQHGAAKTPTGAKAGKLPKAGQQQQAASIVDSDGSIAIAKIDELLKVVPHTIPPVIQFMDNVGTNLSVPFSTNCVLIYPDDHVAFTLIHSTVVRIQIGKGVVKPPDDTGLESNSGSPVH